MMAPGPSNSCLKEAADASRLTWTLVCADQWGWVSVERTHSAISVRSFKKTNKRLREATDVCRVDRFTSPLACR